MPLVHTHLSPSLELRYEKYVDFETQSPVPLVMTGAPEWAPSIHFVVYIKLGERRETMDQL